MSPTVYEEVVDFKRRVCFKPLGTGLSKLTLNQISTVKSSDSVGLRFRAPVLDAYDPEENRVPRLGNL